MDTQSTKPIDLRKDTADSTASSLQISTIAAEGPKYAAKARAVVWPGKPVVEYFEECLWSSDPNMLFNFIHLNADQFEKLRTLVTSDSSSIDYVQLFLFLRYLATGAAHAALARHFKIASKEVGRPSSEWRVRSRR